MHPRARRRPGLVTSSLPARGHPRARTASARGTENFSEISISNAGALAHTWNPERATSACSVALRGWPGCACAGSAIAVALATSMRPAGRQPLAASAALRRQCHLLGAVAVAAVANETHCGPDFCTCWHSTGELNADMPVANENVRQSRRYLVLVGSAIGAGEFAHSFAYEAIPRNGNGAIFSPNDPPHSGTFNGSAGNQNGDGITVEEPVGVTMAWSQFEHAVDVDVKILPRDGTSLGPASDVILRPQSLGLRARASDDGGVLIRVPRSERSHGLQFSVEFSSDLHTYRSDGTGYVDSGGSIVGVEPTNALLIFASPFLPAEALPPRAATRKVMHPGPINQNDWGSAEVLYFPPGVYWLEPKGQSRILLDPATQWVHLDAGAYVKGAIEYTTEAPRFAATGHGVLSGEHYVYQANPLEHYSSVKSDKDSLRMWRHNHVVSGQSWLLRGPTIVAPPFNSMDLFGPGAGSVHISDYKQVGAWFFQTDGPEMGTWELDAYVMHSSGSVVQDVFYHINDDGLKLCLLL